VVLFEKVFFTQRAQSFSQRTQRITTQFHFVVIAVKAEPSTKHQELQHKKQLQKPQKPQKLS